jgi:hypothetical protein
MPISLGLELGKDDSRKDAKGTKFSESKKPFSLQPWRLGARISVEFVSCRENLC